MRVFLNAPCTLQGQLPRLPQSLTALSVLANLPSLAKVCSVQPESPIARAELCAREDHIELKLCAYTDITEEADVDDDDVPIGDGWLSTESMWLQRAEPPDQDVLEVPDTSMYREVFTLVHKPGVVVCRLITTSSKLEGARLHLPEYCCLCLGSGWTRHSIADVHQPNLKNVKFYGMSTLAMNSSFHREPDVGQEYADFVMLIRAHIPST